MNKKRMILTLALLGVMLVLFGCGKKTSNDADSDKIKVISTVFAPYDFAKQVAGEHAEVSMLLPPGTESHSYEPTPQDIIKIQNCDVFVYVGGESDEWVTDILDSVTDKGIKIVKLTDCVDLVEEETVEGMEAEHEESEESEAEDEFDEHVWTSPKNAQKIVTKIKDALITVDKDHEGTYEENAKSYIGQLQELDQQFQSVVDQAKRKTFIFADRFPLRYFADAYGLEYYAAFPGCSTDTEPSAATVAFLANKVKSEKIPVVFYIEMSNQKMADTICEETGAKKLLFHACHNVTKEDFKNGVTYLKLMEKNVENLKTALN